MGGRVDAVEVFVSPVVVDVLLAGAGDVHAGAGGIGAHRRAAADPVSKTRGGKGIMRSFNLPLLFGRNKDTNRSCEIATKDGEVEGALRELLDGRLIEAWEKVAFHQRIC